MPLVPAKCPECGGLVEVDNEKRAGICQHCGEAFTIEDAIQTFNTYYQTTNNYNTTHNYGEGSVVNVYEDASKDFVIEAGVLKEYHGESTDVVLPNNIKSIIPYCFEGMPIESITINSAINIKNLIEALKACYSLKSIKVEGADCDYITVNGVVYNKDISEMLFFPNNKEELSFSIPDSVMKIDHQPRMVLNNFQSVMYRGMNIFDMSCTDDIKSISTFPYRITKHNYIDGICENCGISDGHSIPVYCTECNKKVGISEDEYEWGSFECPKCGNYVVIEKDD